MKTMQSFVGKVCLIRTYSAGVHFGILESHDEKQVVLINARRVWNWQGANTLNEIAINGCAATSKISESVPVILLTEAIEIIPMSATAITCMESIKWE